MSTSTPNIVMFGNLAKQIADTYEKKHADYGNSFTDSVERYGYVAGIVRMSYKFHRVENLLIGGKEALVNDESAVDTLLDLAAYSIMLAMEVLNRKK